MVKLKDKDYLNGEEAIKNNIHIVTIVETPTYEDVQVSEDKTKNVARLTVKDEKENDWFYTPNKTTRINLKEFWGNEMDDWKDKQIELDIVEEKVKKEMKKVIYGKPYVKPEQENA